MLELDSSSSAMDYQDTESQNNPISIKSLSSLIYGQEYTAQAGLRTVYHAITGEAVYQVGSQGIDTQAVVNYAKQKGSTIATWTFHQRANALKQVAQYLLERKEEFYQLAKSTGCTRKDAWIDIEGGIGRIS